MSRILIVALCVAVIAGAAFVFRTRISAGAIETLLREHVAVGSPHEQVSRVLDSLRVEHSAYDPQRREILALWKRSYRSLFEEGSIQARFVFGPEGHLLHYEIKELVTAT